MSGLRGQVASLRHILESAGPPQDSVAHLRNSPLTVCSYQIRVDNTAGNKKVVCFIRIGVAALPHVHGDEIGPDVRRSAVEGDIVTGHEVLRAFETGEAFLMAGTDGFGPDQ